jgi:hypothetical protein
MRRLRLTPLRLAGAVLIGSFAFTGVAYAASLGLSSNKLWAWGQTLTKGTCNQTYTTADDTFVQGGPGGNTPQGGATTLSINPGGPGAKDAFIRFDLSGCALATTAGADSASLTVFVTSSSAHTVSLYPVYSSWSGSTLVMSGVSSLTIGSTATTSFTASAGSHTVTVTADVDAAIKAGVLWGWELKDTTGGMGNEALASAENSTVANRPSLTLSYAR